MSITPLMPVYPRCGVRPVRGEGAYLIGERGERYLDFASGIAVNLLGHGHPHLTKAIQDQAATLMHVSNLYGSPQGEAFAQRLVDNTFADTVFFTNSGAEAVECAIKTARAYHSSAGNAEKHVLITFNNAFHGRTLGTISATNQEKLRKGFDPLLPGFAYAPFDDLNAALDLVDDNTAGFLVEPVQGEGGIRPVPKEFLQELRGLCDEYGLLLILDEVQSGVGRTGRLFAHEWSGVTPDIMAVAKGIGGGFPMGACLATGEAASGMVAGTHGSTYGGNPLAMAVGNAVLDVVLEEGFLEHVRDVALVFRQGLAALKDRFPEIIEDVRGEGLMLGIKSKIPVAELLAAVRAEKLLGVPAGDNVLRLLPPLTVTAEEAREGLARIERAAEKLTAAKAA